MKWKYRLLGFSGCILALGLDIYLMLNSKPSINRNTGLPDSGLFGWIGSVLIIVSLGFLFYGPPKKDES